MRKVLAIVLISVVCSTVSLSAQVYPMVAQTGGSVVDHFLRFTVLFGLWYRVVKSCQGRRSGQWHAESFFSVFVSQIAVIHAKIR
ncbi:MAG TPA: hypothetical protein DEZ27_00590 [Sphaerochaeta sp.]|nr:hypothetical protein [Sphaerochaeta sp.]